MPVTERLLQFIWRFQYFNKAELITAEGERLQIILPGQYNNNQGPDFTNAKIVIGNTTWAGTIELHIKTSDWRKHKHERDKNYDSVVLHVVWDDDSPGHSPEEVNTIPVLELKNRVAKVLLDRYEELMHSPAFIPCEKSIHLVRDITWNSWKERLLAERLLRKAAIAENYLQQNNSHWEEVFWWMLAKNFGMKVNAEAFEAMARSLSLNILAKHKNQIHQVEALLMGQTGLLDKNFEDDYPALLKREYKFLKSKYNLEPIHISLYSLRMRPGNFPVIRLAQLAMLVHQSSHLFSKIKETESAKEIRELFDVTANDYWHYHYQFDEASSFRKKKTGVSMVDNIIINTVTPILFAYGSYHNENKYKEKALHCLEQVSPEKNVITKGFEKLNVENKNAWDSQALIELKNEYCSKHKCLSCATGNAILKQPA
ncbi:DUF2851 family protein [Terrimonas pollutisoli]|uniref:DUF2851 family protein n=1 Tax=Terrimonas pollutisoli TaxID=3034147 RepID=UPI0023EBBF8D|nr:DUF2851 family protein [Terrimonas sp. H1YJ31]